MEIQRLKRLRSPQLLRNSSAPWPWGLTLPAAPTGEAPAPDLVAPPDGVDHHLTAEEEVFAAFFSGGPAALPVPIAGPPAAQRAVRRQTTMNRVERLQQELLHEQELRQRAEAHSRELARHGGGEAPMTREERQKYLSATPLGQAVLDAERGKP